MEVDGIFTKGAKMKRFFIALFLCFISFSVKAVTISGYISSFFISDPVESAYVRAGFSRIDEELRAYIDQSDFEFTKENCYGFYEEYEESKANGKERAAVDMEGNYYELVILKSSFYRNPKTTKAKIQSVVHHEVQHAKDHITMSENGYGRSYTENLDRISTVLFHSILEARAYSEEAAFVYNKKEELYKVMKELEKKKDLDQYSYLDIELRETINKAVSLLNKQEWGAGNLSSENVKQIYEEIKAEYELFENEYGRFEANYTFFRDALVEGKTAEEARHTTASDILSSYFFDGYIDGDSNGDDYMHWPVGENHLSAEEIIKILGDEFTLQDLYASEGFWVTICSYEDTTSTGECKLAQKRFTDKNCIMADCAAFNTFFSRIVYNPNKKKLTTEELTKKVNEVIEIDKGACGGEPKRRILVTKDEEDKYSKDMMRLYKICCTSEDWNFMWLTKKDPNYDYSIFE